MARKARKGAIKHIGNARKNKNDEFYTRLADIERELKHYQHHFAGKTVLCNCDDPRVSNFFHYFSYNFERLGLKKLISTCYKNQQPDLFSWQNPVEKGIFITYGGEKNDGKVPTPEAMKIKNFKGDGDFRSEECIELLKEADIVVTNPPFSLFREYVGQLVKYNKKMLIIGTWNAVSYKEIFKLIKENKLWIGVNSNRNISGFIVPPHYPLSGGEARVDDKGNRIVSSNNNCWYTNLDIAKRHEELILYKEYNKTEFPTYDNYNAIEVSKTNDIPIDYDGVMGVPITFMNKYNPAQFEILGMASSAGYSEEVVGIPFIGKKDARPLINGEVKYARIIIQHRKEEEE